MIRLLNILFVFGVAAGTARAVTVHDFERNALPAASLGMGGSGVALGGSLEQTALNPAALACIPVNSVEISGSNSVLSFDQTMSSLALGYRAKSLGALSVGFQSYGVSGIQLYGADGSYGGDAKASSYRYSLGYAFAPQRGPSVGIMLHGYRDDLLGVVGEGRSLDTGLQTELLDGHLGLGLAVTGLFAQTGYADGPLETADPAVRLGLAYAFQAIPLRCQLDLSQNDGLWAAVGGEWSYRVLRLRGGYGQQLSLGAGLEMDDFRLDYAYLFAAPNLEGAIRVSADVKFDLGRINASPTAFPTSP